MGKQFFNDTGKMSTSQFTQLHQGSELMLFSASIETTLELPLFPFGISAGFPSPAIDFSDLSIDLNEHLIRHPAATYYGRVQGNSMKEAGIEDGDLLIIDRSLEPTNGKIAVCYLNGEFTLKKIRIENGKVWLDSANKDYPPIELSEGDELTIWGIVTYVIKKIS